MGYIPDELSADEARNLYLQGELSADEARHLSGGSYDPDRESGKDRDCVYNGCGQRGYWDSNDRWHYVHDDD